MSQSICNFFLTYANAILTTENGLVYGLLILSLLGFNKSAIRVAICVLCVVCLNAFLKQVFKMPLPPQTTAKFHTYGFPSGHAAFATTYFLAIMLELYGILFKHKNAFRCICIVLSILLLTTYHHLIINHYHFTFHIIGSVFESIIAVFCLHRFVFSIQNRRRQFRIILIILIIATILALITMSNLVSKPQTFLSKIIFFNFIAILTSYFNLILQYPSNKY